jgi:hypothetical protein
MKLIKEETFELVKNVIQESAEKPKQYFVEGITIQTDTKNRNGRVYPDEFMGRELALYAEEKLKKNRAFGEYGHPDNAKINEERISHRFINITKSGHDYSSKAIIMGEGLGKIVRGIIDIEGVLGTSSRAVGTLEEKDGANYVQSNLHLITPGDLVIEPSAQAAFVRGIKENAEFEFKDGILIEMVLDEVDHKYKAKMSVEEKQAILIETFQKLIRELTKK